MDFWQLPNCVLLRRRNTWQSHCTEIKGCQYFVIRGCHQATYHWCLQGVHWRQETFQSCSSPSSLGTVLALLKILKAHQWNWWLFCLFLASKGLLLSICQKCQQDKPVITSHRAESLSASLFLHKKSQLDPQFKDALKHIPPVESHLTSMWNEILMIGIHLLRKPSE